MSTLQSGSDPSPSVVRFLSAYDDLVVRVLAVDDDPTCLSILEKMLQKFMHRVTKCSSADVVLKLLRESGKEFDIVICEGHIAEMDGFELLECVKLIIDIPFILMSADNSKSAVSKGKARGACDYLRKPISIEALKNIWLHVVQLHQLREKERIEHMKNVSDDSSYDEELDPNADDQDPESGVIWTTAIHQKFVDDVNQLGGVNKAIPGRILKLMNVRNLTVEYVAFQLHHYRLFLRNSVGNAAP